MGLCRFEVGELDLQLLDEADFRTLPPPPTVIALGPVHATTSQTDTGLVEAASIAPRPPSRSLSEWHRMHWFDKGKPSAQRGLLTRFAQWIELGNRIPSAKPQQRHRDLDEHPARISLLGEMLPRATMPSNTNLFGVDTPPLETLRTDFVAAAYALQLDRAIRVLLSKEDVAEDARAELGQLLELPRERDVAEDYFGRLARFAPGYASLSDETKKNAAPGLSLAGLATDVWKLPARVGEALIAAKCPTLPPIVRITPENPLPGLLVLCKALQLWQRPRIIGGEELIELHAMHIDGLELPEKGQPPRIAETLVFRFDWRGNEATLRKTSFDENVVRKTMQDALSRLRIAAEAFPNIRVELLFPQNTVHLEVVREAVAPVARSTTEIVPAKPSTWTELSRILQSAPDRETIARVRSIFASLSPEEAVQAQDLLRTIVGRVDVGDDVRLEAAEYLAGFVYDEPSNERRMAIADAFLALAQQADRSADTRHKAYSNLLAIFAGLPLDEAERIAQALREADQRGNLPASLKPRLDGALRRHARLLEARSANSSSTAKTKR